MAKETKKWVIGVHSERGNDIEFYTFEGTKAEAKKKLVEVVRNNRKGEENFINDTVKASDVEEKQDGKLYAFTVFKGMALEYVASPLDAMPDINIKVASSPKKEEKKEEKKTVDEVIKEIAKSAAKELKGDNMIDDPRGSSYYNLKSYATEDDEDTVLNLCISVCKYRDTADRHLYYGIYSIVEIDGGDDIGDAEWEYTDDVKTSSLEKALREIYDALTDDELKKQYGEFLKEHE